MTRPARHADPRPNRQRRTALAGFVSYEAAVGLALIMAFAGPLAFQAAQVSRQSRQAEAHRQLLAETERACMLAGAAIDPVVLALPGLTAPEGLQVALGRESVAIGEIVVPGLERVTCRGLDREGREVRLTVFTLIASPDLNAGQPNPESDRDGSLPGEARQ